MKYAYEGAELEKLIQNYKIVDDRIIVTLFDGTNYKIPLTEENENTLLNLMLQQAQERSEKSPVSDARFKKNQLLIGELANIFFAMSCVANIHTHDSKIMKLFFGFSGCVMGLQILSTFSNYKMAKDKFEELRKYDIYLSIRERLDSLFNEKLPLNINTLDKYSLKDIQTIESKLNEIEKFSSFSRENHHKQNLTYTKKIGK